MARPKFQQAWSRWGPPGALGPGPRTPRLQLSRRSFHDADSMQGQKNEGKTNALYSTALLCSLWAAPVACGRCEGREAHWEAMKVGSRPRPEDGPLASGVNGPCNLHEGRSSAGESLARMADTPHSAWRACFQARPHQGELWQRGAQGRRERPGSFGGHNAPAPHWPGVLLIWQWPSPDGSAVLAGPGVTAAARHMP